MKTRLLVATVALIGVTCAVASAQQRNYAGGGGGGTPGGSSGQVQYNNSGVFGGFTVSGDGTLNTGTGALSVTKTGGTSFAPSATTDTTNAGNVSSGTLSPARGGTGVSNGTNTLTLGGNTTLPAAPASTQCLHMANTGAITATGSDCGSGGGGTFASNQTTPTGSFTSSSTTIFTALGFGLTITPSATGKILVTFGFHAKNTTAIGDGGQFEIVYNTGTPPNIGGSIVGATTCTSQLRIFGSASTNAGAFYPISMTCLITGLSVGTTYWIDAAGAAFNGGTVTAAAQQFGLGTAVELP